ncbi:MAG: CCA tRNA nucleotidyltransferase [Bacteroidales bacterium]|nr:CCA tRNA nucleotidyltransferase [Bacteroidales bacterium]
MNYKQYLTHPVYPYVAKAADSMGLEAYAVGGVVRDIILHRHNTDIDIVTVGSGIALATATAALISPDLHINVYKNFGTAQFKFHDYEIEFVGARRESYSHDSRKPVVEDGTLEDDQLRRDFTINAMAIALNGPKQYELIDPFNGLQDIKDKIIRTPCDPDKTFSDDPLRMMRAVRFATQLNFDIYPETFEAIKRNAYRLEIISNERIIEEFNKILLCIRPSRGIKLLDECGLLEKFLPELLDLKGVEIVNGKGHKDNYLHTLEVVDNVAMSTTNLWLVWAALLHDIAKPATKRFDPQVGWTFHGHEVLGSKMVSRIFHRLHMPNNEKMKYVQKLVGLHLRPIALVEDTITDSAVRRLLFEAGDDIDDLMRLCEADVTSKNSSKIHRCFQNFAKVREKLIDIEEKDKMRNWRPPITGEDIMQTFALNPCREIGIIKDAVSNAILDCEIDNTREAAIARMLEEGAKLGLTPVENLKL